MRMQPAILALKLATWCCMIVSCNVQGSDAAVSPQCCYNRDRLHTHARASLHCTAKSSFALAHASNGPWVAPCSSTSLQHSFEASMRSRTCCEAAAPGSTQLCACLIGQLLSGAALLLFGSKPRYCSRNRLQVQLPVCQQQNLAVSRRKIESHSSMQYALQRPPTATAHTQTPSGALLHLLEGLCKVSAVSHDICLAVAQQCPLNQ